MSNKVEQAFPFLEKAVDAAASMKRRSDQALWLVHLGEAHLAMGRTDDASSCAEQAIELAGNFREKGNQAYGLRLLGEIAAHSAPLEAEKAEAYYRQAIALAEELGMRPLVAHCHLGLGKLYRRAGKSEQADSHLTTAATMYREMKMSFWLEQVENEKLQRP
jgi:tetratricopeptide (TPR) repeat protein